jgi:hypothetical protein
MLVYNNIRGQLVHIQFELLTFLSSWWWCDGVMTSGYHGVFISMTALLQRILVGALWLLFYLHRLARGKDKDISPSSVGELTGFLGLVNWVIQFIENGVNWNNALLDGVRSRSHYAPVSIINGGEFSVGTHPLLIGNNSAFKFKLFVKFL